MSSPFEVLGLPERPDLSDDDVRAAWRRIASATHPDRDDGGDPERYAAAAAAYALLRTGWDRSEAYADLASAAARSPSRIGLRTSRVWALALRAACAAGVSAAAYLTVGSQPAAPALTTAALTWLVLTGRRDLGS